jgi:hypothetical protein
MLYFSEIPPVDNNRLVSHSLWLSLLRRFAFAPSVNGLWSAAGAVAPCPASLRLGGSSLRSVGQPHSSHHSAVLLCQASLFPPQFGLYLPLHFVGFPCKLPPRCGGSVTLKPSAFSQPPSYCKGFALLNKLRTLCVLALANAPLLIRCLLSFRLTLRVPLRSVYLAAFVYVLPCCAVRGQPRSLVLRSLVTPLRNTRQSSCLALLRWSQSIATLLGCCTRLRLFVASLNCIAAAAPCGCPRAVFVFNKWSSTP